MNNIEILEKLKDEQYTKETLITICKFYDEEFKPYVLSTEERDALENLIKEYKELKNQLNDIHSNFCKFNWKESNNIQVYNQLKELYESIYRKGNK